MGKGKRYQNKKKKTAKIILSIILLVSMIGISSYLIYDKEQEEKIPQRYNLSSNVVQTSESIQIHTKENQNLVSIKPNVIEEEKEQVSNLVNTIPTEYRGYDVDAKLEIPSIDLETYVLKNYSTNALLISVTKFFGGDPNEIGNYCISGHNFKNSNMFRNLKKLKLKDEIILTDQKNRTYQYEIYDIYKVLPEETSSLSQKTNGKTIMTLITCTSDSKERIIVQAEKKDN